VSVYILRPIMSTISLNLAKPGKAMPAGAVQQLDGASPACVPERSRTGGPWEENEDQRRRRYSTSTFNFKQRSHAPQRGACDCQERIRQLVMFTPASVILTTWADFRPQQ